MRDQHSNLTEADWSLIYKRQIISLIYMLKTGQNPHLPEMINGPICQREINCKLTPLLLGDEWFHLLEKYEQSPLLKEYKWSLPGVRWINSAIARVPSGRSWSPAYHLLERDQHSHLLEGDHRCSSSRVRSTFSSARGWSPVSYPEVGTRNFFFLSPQSQFRNLKEALP